MVRKRLCAVFCLLLLLSCTPQAQTPAQVSLFIYRLNPPAFVEYSTDFQPVKEILFSVPPDCSLLDVFPAPVGKYLLVELSCPNGQTVLFWDSESGSWTQPVTESDSHFLAWARDGKSAYLKVDSLGNSDLARVSVQGQNTFIPVTAFTYDLSPNPTSRDFTFTFSRGMGQGSEIWLAKRDGKLVQQLYADPLHYISFARYSPDGKQIAFIKIPDSQTPFTVGELWVMGSDGGHPRKLADADAGHGYAAEWSPDGKWIVFVKRENVEDANADQSAESLISNVYMTNTQSGELKQITFFTNGRAESPHWSPQGNTLAFNTVLDGRMEVQIADIASGEIYSLASGPVCCPAWIRK
jgi:Tol biopolymer transport system component